MVANGFSIKKYARILTLAVGLCVCSPAFAQTPPQPSPQPFSAPDENGVDLGTMAFDKSGIDVSIGDESNGLSYGLVAGSSTINYRLGVSASAVTVFLGGRTELFVPGPYGYGWVSALANGSTLTKTIVGITPNWLFTGADGTQILFNQATLNCNTQCNFPDYVLKPNGERLQFRIQSTTYCTDPTLPCEKQITMNRLSSVTNNHGYQLKFTYDFNGTIPYDDGIHPKRWQRRVKVQAINNAEEYCSPTASTCTLTKPWPYVDYSEATSGTTTYRTTTDAAGNATRYTYVSGSLTAIRRPGAATDSTTLGYSSGLTLTNEKGIWTYNKSIAGTLRTLTVTGPAGYTRTVVSETKYNRPVSDTDPTGRTTTYQYDSFGRLTRTTLPEGDYVQHSYDARGNVTETRRVSKTPGTPADIVTSAAYPATCSNPVTCNLPTSTTDARGFVTDYSYDPVHGGVLTVTAPAPSPGATRPQTRYSYTTLNAYAKNASGSVFATTPAITKLTQISTCQTGATCAGTADEQRTTLSYGSAGVANNLHVTAVTSGAGDSSLTATTTASYDSIGNLVAVDGPLSGADDTTRARYDAIRRQVGLIGPDPDGAGPRPRGARRITYNADSQVTLDEVGTVAGITDPDWAAFVAAQSSATIYDGNGRPITTKAISGGMTHALSQISYDARGRAECTAQRMNPASWGSLPTSACTAAAAGSHGPDRITTSFYDAANRVTKVQTAVGAPEQSDEVTTSYTNNGQVAYVVDAENNRTAHTYDGHDRLVKTEYPSTTKGANAANAADYEQIGYGAGGIMTSRRLRDGTTINYGYDNLGRLVSKDLPGSEPDTTYSYDLLGRALGVVQGGQTLWFTHDALGRNLTQTGPLGTIGYTYDAAGRRTSMVYPGGVLTVNYDYDVTGNVTKVRENGATSGVGVLASYAFDNLGRGTSVTFGNGSVQSVAYDAVSRLSSLTNNLGGAATTHDLTQTFAYNPASQIASVTRSNDAYAWKAHYNVDRAYVTDGLNRIMNASGLGFGYDARGNLTSDGTNAYTYTAENLLKAGPAGATLAYDPLGRLYQTVGGGATTRLQYDGADLIAEYNAAGAAQRRYVHGPGTDNPIVWYEGSTIDGTARRFLMADERGSIVSITDSAGATININAYDEYGIPAPGNIGRFGYTGQTWLPELRMWYYKARVYSPTLGRFLQSDPIGYSDGMNWYNYVGSDPVNGADPGGQCKVSTGSRICGGGGAYMSADGGALGILGGSGGGAGGSFETYVPGPSGGIGTDGSIVVNGGRFVTVALPRPQGGGRNPGLLEMMNEARAATVKKQREACGASPFKEVMSSRSFKNVESNLVSLSRRDGWEYARVNFGGNYYGSPFTSGLPDRVNIPRWRLRGYNILAGIFYSKANILIHTHFDSAPGLSGKMGDVGSSNESGIPIMAIDFADGRENQYYCHIPEG